METSTKDDSKQGDGGQSTGENASRLAQTQVNPSVDTNADPGATPDGPKGSQEKRDFLTEDNASLVAGSGNTLGDGRTANGTPSPEERGKVS